MSDKLYRLQAVAEELANALDSGNVDTITRDSVMLLVHSLNEAYILWADEVDTKEALGVH